MNDRPEIEQRSRDDLIALVVKLTTTVERLQAVVYQVRKRHRNEDVREALPADDSGVMGCDRGKSYDAWALRRVKQQKCLCHVLRSLAIEIEADPEKAFAVALKERLGAAHALWRAYRAGWMNRLWRAYRPEIGSEIGPEIGPEIASTDGC